MTLGAKKVYNIVWMLFLAIALFLYFYSNLENISIVWELPDEVGYLYNAAFLAGKDWSGYADFIDVYYGYGYSLILIPLFFICDTGSEIIKMAILINYIIVILTYFIQVYILKKIFHKQNSYVIALVAFILNFFPYVVASANKVICEVFLNFQIWLIALFFYKLVVTKRKMYCVILGALAAFIYYTHARAIAVAVTVFALMILFSVIIKRKKYIIYFGVSIGIFYIICYKVRGGIFSSLYSGVAESGQIGNVLNSNYIIQRILWLINFSNIKAYILNAFCKLFYIITASALTAIYAFAHIGKVVLKEIKRIKIWSPDKYLLLYFSSTFAVMFVLCCISGDGFDFASVFYGRYIEYVVSPLIGIGLLAYLETDNVKNKFLPCLMILTIGVLTSQKLIFLDSSNIGVDTSRIAGFSYWITKNDNSYTFIYSQTLLLIIGFLLLCFLKKFQRLDKAILALVLSVFLLNDQKGIDKINGVHRGNKIEIEMADYINSIREDEIVYFINRDYSYIGTCTRMQVLLLNESMVVLSMDDYTDYIKENAYIIAYAQSKTDGELSERYSFVLNKGQYNLYHN